MKHTLIQNIAGEPQQDSFSGCSHGAIPAARRAANAPPIFVNGIGIAETAIAQEAQNHSAATGAEARAAAARALVIRELLLQRARALELAPAPAYDAEGREETADEALVRRVLELEASPIEPSEAECKRVYESAAAQFTSPECYEASHILFSPETEGAAAWAAAHLRADETIKSIAEGEDFASLARVSSTCPTATQGGSLGQLQRGDLAAEVEDALLSLLPGTVGPAPVRSRHGWHIVRLDRLVPTQQLPFEAVESFIRSSLRTRAWAAASTRYVAALAASAKIEGLSLSLGPQP
jgi:peptidyl-prolyl cis-trans isomerase C